MTLQKASDLQHQQQTTTEKNTKEQQQDQKNADYIRQMKQPNHPNT